jgi:acetyl-CoA acetyltransferase
VPWESLGIDGPPLTRDESIRDGGTPDTMARLKPAFRADGTVTAGNASTLNDGASAVLLAGAEAADRLGLRPMARIVSRAVHAVDPQYFGIGPVEASRKALRKAGIGWDDLTLVELNEAYAVSPTNSYGAVAATGSPRSASAWDRAWRW